MKWEYKIVNYTKIDKLKVGLFKEGQKGWELVGVTSSPTPLNIVFSCFFKRPLIINEDK